MIWLVLLIGFILRLISLNQSLWLDEAINVLGAKNNSFLGMVTNYARFDFHPPGYFAILWLWSKTFGFSEVSVRMPSVIFGVATIFFVYLIGWKLHSRVLGLIAALLVSVNPLNIYYSQEARMYIFAATAVSLNFLLFVKLLKNEGPNKIFLFLSNLLVLLSDYLTYLIFPAQFTVLLSLKKLQVFKTWFISLIFAILAFSWWVPIFLAQVNIGLITSQNIPGWKMVVGDFGIKSLFLTYVKFIIGRISYPDNMIYVLFFLPVGLLFLFLIWQAIVSSNKLHRTILLSWIGLPIISAWLISILVPIYSYFRMIFTLPPFVLLISVGILKFQSRVKYLLLIFVVAAELVFSFFYLFNPTFHREDWRSLVNFLKANQVNSKILFESNGSFAPFDYYADGMVNGIGALRNFPAKSQSDLIDLESRLEGVMNLYLVDYLVEISDPQRLISKKLTELGYKKLDIKNFNGLGFVYQYTK